MPIPNTENTKSQTQRQPVLHRLATARWSGSLKDGFGSISSESGALQNAEFGFHSRFENKRGTNPEELIGAAHAGCFSMAFANALSEAGHVPDRIDTQADVSLEKRGQAWAITSVQLTVRGIAPGCSDGAFEAIARETIENCPISQLLNARITLRAELEQSRLQ